MDRNLALEFVRVTEAAAIAAAQWIGRGDGKKADGAAVDEMRDRFNQIDFSGRIVIGEGAKDEAPQLYTGEKVGRGTKPYVDLAVDPLECTDSVAYGRYNAMSVIAAGAKGSLLSGPDVYMSKLAVGPKAAKLVRLDAPLATNLQKTARALKKKVNEMTVIILDRERNKPFVEQVRKAKARVRLISDGDVAGAIAPSLPGSGVDMLVGTGASAESVLAAAAIKTLGGQLLARFWAKNDQQKNLIHKHGLNERKVYSVGDLAKGNVLTFTATGIIDGPLLKGIEFFGDTVVTHSLVIRSQSGTLRYITTYHKHKNYS